MSDLGEDLEPVATPSRHSTRAKIALGLALLAAVTAVLMRSTVAGESDLAATAVGGDSSAILATTLGFAAVVILVIAAIIASLEPLITNRGRPMAIVALIVALAAPLLGTAVGGLLSVVG